MPLVPRRFLWLPFVLAAHGRLAAPQVVNGYRVDSYTSDEGLPSQAVSDVVQTTDGFVWIASGGMLARFDGTQFRVFSQANNAALARRITRLAVGRADTLWMLDEGNAVLALASGRITEVVAPSKLIFGDLSVDGAGNLFGFAYGVAWRLERGGTEHVASDPPTARLPWHSFRPTRDRDGRLWILDRAMIPRVLGDTAARFDRRGPVVAIVSSRANGEILVVRERGIWRDLVRANGDVVLTYRSVPNELPAFVDGDERLWVWTPGTYDVFTRGSTEPSARIPKHSNGVGTLLFEGEAGCAWSFELEVRRMCRVAFGTVPLNLAEPQYVERGTFGAALSWDSFGRVAPLTPNGIGPALQPARADFHHARVYVDKRGIAWWSPAAIYATLGASSVRDSLHYLPHRDASAFAADTGTATAVWYGVANRLYHATLPSRGSAHVIDSVAVPGIARAIAVAPDGTVWAVMLRPDLSSALIRVRRGAATMYTTRDGLPRAALRAVLPDSDGTVWLGTYGGGLVRFQNGRFTAVTRSEGLGDDVVTSLLDDSAGNIWMGGNQSVHRVSRRSLSAFFEGRERKVRAVTYGRTDGLTEPETTGQPGVRDDSGRFWFPTIAGASFVSPSFAIALDSVRPRIHVLGVEASGVAVPMDSSVIRIPPGARRLTIAYSAIASRSANPTRYEYRIDGVDADWIDAGVSRTATYNAVGPGTHTFRVRATNGGGFTSARDATLTFVVPRAFYETLPFALLVTFSLALLGWSGQKYRERGLKRRERELVHAVNERTHKLEAALHTVASQADQLRTLDDAKSRFFANVSHEFRTPLSLIIGPVEDLRDGRSGELPAIVRRQLDLVRDNADRLLQLVEQLLDVARLESGKLHLTAEVHDLVPLLQRMADSFASLADRRGISFRLSRPVGSLRVRYDPDQMEKVISNLVGNALKFTPRGGSVELRASAAAEGEAWAMIEVADSGPGIAPEYHERIFERFFQVDDSARRVYEGAGIGLALVRELVELHGGTVAVQSTEGSGSTFIVRLPLATGPARTALEPRVTEHSALRATGISEEHAIAPVPGPSVDAVTVLVVEDNAALLEYLRGHLAGRYRVLTAPSGLRGLEMARAHFPDLIVSDVMMPEMDGQALCAAVKGDAEIDFIPVILLTARASRDARLEGLAGGADDYLTKPVDLQELMVRADNLIQSRRRVRERWRATNQQLPSIVVPVKAPPRDASAAALLASFTQVLAAHLADEDFNIDAMATAMGMGRSTLYRRLEPLLGVSPMDALWEYRIAQAAQWLVETSISVSETAYGVGFKSVPHFCGKFRERYGETPSGYRRSRRAATTA